MSITASVARVALLKIVQVGLVIVASPLYVCSGTWWR